MTGKIFKVNLRAVAITAYMAGIACLPLTAVAAMKVNNSFVAPVASLAPSSSSVSLVNSGSPVVKADPAVTNNVSGGAISDVSYPKPTQQPQPAKTVRDTNISAATNMVASPTPTINLIKELGANERLAKAAGVGEKGKKEGSDLPRSPQKITRVMEQTSGAGVRDLPFEDNEQISVVLSNRDINRVVVKGDKIQSVNGPTGLYLAKNDATGSAYISAFGEAAFTVFISTVNGHNCSLLVRPRAIAGRTVVLQATTMLAPQLAEGESYQKLLVDFITGMINNDLAEVDSYIKGKDKKTEKWDFYGVANIRQVGSYSSANLLGTISEIENKSNKPLTLKPSYFYKRGVRAVALSRQTLAPTEIGLLYQVVGSD